MSLVLLFFLKHGSSCCCANWMLQEKHTVILFDTVQVQFNCFSFDLSVVHMGCCDSSGGSDHAHGRRQSGGRHWAASANPQGEISHYFVLVFVFCFNNNHRSFMVPHLVRALSAYKDIRMIISSCTHAHTHAHSLQIHALLAMSFTHTCTFTTNTCITGNEFVEWEQKQQQISIQKKRVFIFDLREWRRMPDRERKRAPDHR